MFKGKRQSSGKLIFSASWSYVALVFFVVLTLGTTYLLYWQVQTYFHERLQERLIAIASTASVQFDPDEIAKIKGSASVQTAEYKKVVLQLQKIRNQNKSLKYIYILRKTSDPNILTFVADADSLNPEEKIDLNQDGIIDELDLLNTPGDPYDISEFPNLRDNAFTIPTVDDELAVDQWGAFLSASAPIKNDEGVANEFIGIDVEVSDYTKITNLAFVPFAIFLFVLLLILIAQTKILVKMWGSRVQFLSDLDRQKDELLGIIAHQLFTPVTAIKWTAEALTQGLHGKLTDAQAGEVNTIHQVGDQLAELVDLLLDVSRIQLNRLSLDVQPLPLEELVSEITTIIKIKADEQKVKLVVEKNQELPVVMLDKRYTRMTIENLLTNAVKYTPEGGTVTWKMGIEGSKELVISVTDTGCGIPLKDQAKIFGKLFRASNVQNVKGNGFGLYVAKGAIEAQGGKISFVSTEGKGTTFMIRLPLNIAPPEEKKESVKKA